jgi:cytochrome oxidase assembly protein ShyY1
MTWFALAATLLGIYLAFVFPRRPAVVPEASA